MQCPKCQFENREGVKFCEECGAKFELECPACKANIPLGRKFCGECGHSFIVTPEFSSKELSINEKLNKIQKYLPKGLTEKILSQRDKIEGERKQVTVMFCDMEGFTPLVEQQGAETAYSIMDRVYELLIHKVHDYGGTVNEMTGDGILALFGAPIALEDAPQRAIRSSLSIHREMVKFNDELKQIKDNIPPIRMRIGIHTGPVVLGTLGNDLRVEFKAVGDTVNIASRMEGLAEPGATYITEHLFRLSEGFFRFESLGKKQIKGKEDSVSVYRVIAPSSRRTRFDVSAERGLTPFAGRERELEILFDAFERAKAGRGQAVSIVSDAGLGKSRLLYEFRKKIANENITFLEGKCLSFSTGVAFHSIIDIVKSNFDIIEGDEDSKITKKIKHSLEVLGANEPRTMPYLLELLGVKDSSSDLISISPEAKKDRIIEALKYITLRISQTQPLVIAIEDLHWIDNCSEDSLKTLIQNISGETVFFIFTYRTEYMPKWSSKSYHSQVNLNRISNRESLTMAKFLLETKDMERKLEEFIIDKTEGIPFFIEEFIKSIKDLKIIERKNGTCYLSKYIEKISVPSTIQDVIMTRIDSLPQGAREVLQTGSVIGREFSGELIKRVTELEKQDLLSNLNSLKDSELLYERGIYQDTKYIFKHALTQDVVSRSILNKHKRILHEKIGYAIEDQCNNNLIEQVEVLAKHFFQAENFEKGAEYSGQAAKKARKSAAFRDAIKYGYKKVFCLESLPKTVDAQKKIIDARVSLSMYCQSLNYHVEGMEAVAPIEDLPQKINYLERLPEIHVARGSFYLWVEEDLQKGIADLTKAISISETSGNLLPLWMAHYYLGVALSYDFKFKEAKVHFEKALELSKMTGQRVGICFALGTESSQCLIYEGNIDLAYEKSKEALNLAMESGDIWLIGMATSCHGSSCFCRGALDEAEQNLTEAVAICEKVFHYTWGAQASSYLGQYYFYRGDFAKAREYFNRTASYLERGKWSPSVANFVMLYETIAQIIIKEQEFILPNLLGYLDKVKLKVWRNWSLRLMGDISLNLNGADNPETEKWIKKAVIADKAAGMKWHLANDYVSYAQFHRQKGNKPRTKENYERAIEIFKECGADGWVTIHEKELSEL